MADINFQARVKDKGINVLSNTEMLAYTGNSNFITVIGTEGGTFVSSNDSLTDDGGLIFPKQGGGHWVRQLNEDATVNVKWYGAKGDGVTDDLAAFNDAFSNNLYYGKTLFIPAGNYILSDTWFIEGQVSIQGEGNPLSHTTQITPSPSFPAGHDLITIVGGYSSIKNIRSDMDEKGGNWVTFSGEGGSNNVENNVVVGVAEGYWCIELRDPGGFNGIAGMNIHENHFYDCLGGGIWGNGGGDSVNIMRNFFQLLRSTGYLLKWDSASGAANFNFSENNGGSAEKFIEINDSTEFKIMKNQFESLTPLTTSSMAMIAINGPTVGSTISDNNLNCHDGNAEVGIFFDNAEACQVINNTITGCINDIKTTSNTSNITYMIGFTDGVLNDAISAVTTLGGTQNVIQGKLRVNDDITIRATKRLYLGTSSFYEVTSGYIESPNNLVLDGTVDIAGLNYRRGSTQILNKAADAFIPFITRNIAGSEVQMNLSNIGSISATSMTGTSMVLGATTGATSAILQVDSTTKGILGTRMTSVQRNAIPSPDEGLDVYDLTTHSKWYYNGTAWIEY